MIRIAIADDHVMFRDALRLLIEAKPELEVVGEASDGDEVVALVRRQRPDILLLDLAMPRRDGLEVLQEMSGADLPTRTILLTASIDQEQTVQAFRLGARGLVLKEAAAETLLKSIHAVMSGEYWVGRQLMSDLLRALLSGAAGVGRAARHDPFHLTRREREVVSAVAAGCSNKEIAQRLSISEQTVKHHLTAIFSKMGVSSRLELALFVSKGTARRPAAERDDA